MRVFLFGTIFIYMKKPVFTSTFFKFFFAFLIILGAAFGVLLYSASKVPPPVNPVDNIAQPQ